MMLESVGQVVRREMDAVGGSVRIIVNSARMQILVVRSHPMVPLSTIVQPTVFLTVFLGTRAHTLPEERATVVAVLLSCLWSATLWAAGGTLRREVADGTLARNLTSVRDPRLVIGGKCLGSTLLVLGLLTATTTAAVGLIGIPFQAGDILRLAFGFVLVAASGTALGFMLCSVFVLTRHAVQVTAALMYPILILGGLLIPTSLIPRPLGWLSHLVSLYWANRLLDSTAAGSSSSYAVMFLLLLTALYFWAGSELLTKVIDHARGEGTIDLG